MPPRLDFEHQFDNVSLVELVERWWNGHWGDLRRDIWLERDGRRWIVRGLIGGVDGRGVTYEFDRDHQARAMVDRLKATTPDDWKNITALLRRGQTGRHGSRP